MRLALLLAFLPSLAVAEQPMALIPPSSFLLQDGEGGYHHELHGETLVVLKDPGGQVMTRYLHIARLELGNIGVQISGLCGSACTFYLGMERHCVMPDATFVFHGPWERGTTMSASRQEEVSLEMSLSYPPAMAAWFMATGRHGEHYLTSQQVIAMGATACPTQRL